MCRPKLKPEASTLRKSSETQGVQEQQKLSANRDQLLSLVTSHQSLTGVGLGMFQQPMPAYFASTSKGNHSQCIVELSELSHHDGLPALIKSQCELHVL